MLTCRPAVCSQFSLSLSLSISLSLARALSLSLSVCLSVYLSSLVRALARAPRALARSPSLSCSEMLTYSTPTFVHNSQAQGWCMVRWSRKTDEV